MKPHSTRFDLSTYPFHIEVQTRFADVDPLWHLNNVRLVEIYQEARTSFNLAIWNGLSLDARSHRLVVARQSIDYLREAKWPGAITIGVGIARLGTKSYSLGLGMFQKSVCVGVSDAVLVYANEVGTAPLPENLRGALKGKLLPEAEAVPSSAP